jgi:hypothetical protein
MKKLTQTRLTMAIGLGTVGAAYISAFGSMDLPFHLENYLVVVPIQLGALVYFFGFRRDLIIKQTKDDAHPKSR